MERDGVTAEARSAGRAGDSRSSLSCSSYPFSPRRSRERSRGSPKVRAFPAGQGDTADFLRLLQPAAVVVDSAEEAEAAAEFAREATRDARARIASRGSSSFTARRRWQNLSDGSASPERIRSAVAAGIY
jgi:hypothetical protein